MSFKLHDVILSTMMQDSVKLSKLHPFASASFQLDPSPNRSPSPGQTLNRPQSPKFGAALVAPAPDTAHAPASAPTSASQPDVQPQPRASATHPTRQIHPICFFRSVSDVLDATVVRNNLYWMLILYHLPQPYSHVQHCSKVSKRFCDHLHAFETYNLVQT